MPAADQERLARILDDYLLAIERGKPITPEELLEKYPEDASQLRGYLSGLQLFHAAAGIDHASARNPLGDVPLPTQTLGDYRLVREIGRGGMGVVYEAWQLSLRRRVALKILPFTVASDAKQLSRFKNEAQAAAQVQHPNIVPVYAVGEENGVHYYVMQLIEGQSLTSLLEGLRSNGQVAEDNTSANNRDLTVAWPSARRTTSASTATHTAAANVAPMRAAETADHIRVVARLAQQAAEALDAAHEYGVVHRDVKPSNLLLDDQGKLWITDFGLARCRETQGLTQTGDVLGTMRYMSPEQALGRSAIIDHRTDIYSLGVTMYELATLHHPADEVSDLLVYFDRNREPPKPLRHWNRHIPRDFQTIVLKCISEFPPERYNTAKDLAGDLGLFLEGRPINASPPSWLTRAGKWAKRRRGVVIAAAAVLIVALVGAELSRTMLASQKAAAKDRALAQARESMRQIGDVLNLFTMQYADELKPIPGAEGVRLRLLRTGLDYWKKFEEQAADDPLLAEEVADAYLKTGALAELLGDKDQALDSYTKAKNLWESRLARDPENADYARYLALAENNLGLLEAQSGNSLNGVALLKQASESQNKLLVDNPDSTELANDLAKTHGNLGLVSMQTGKIAEALREFQAAIAIQERLAAAPDAREDVLQSLAASYNNYASLQDNDVKLAAEAYRKATAIQKKLVEAYPNTRAYQANLARTYNNLGYLYSHAKEWENAESSYGNAILLQEELVNASPLAGAYRRDLAISYNNRGMVQSRVGKLAQAETSFERAAQLQDELLVAKPTDVETRSNQGGVWNNLASLLDQQKKYAEAERAYQQAIANQRRALEASPSNDRYRALLSRHYLNAARNFALQSKFDSAIQMALARKQLWPANADKLYSVAQQLAATYGQMRTTSVAAKTQVDCVREAVGTLREAVAAGLPNEKLKDKSLASLAGSEDYRKLLDETMSVTKPAARQTAL